MSGGSTGFEVVFGIKNRAELADFKWLGGRTNVESGISLNPRGEGNCRSYDMPTMQIQGDLFRQKTAIQDCCESSPLEPIGLKKIGSLEIITRHGHFNPYHINQIDECTFQKKLNTPCVPPSISVSQPKLDAVLSLERSLLSRTASP